jgi:hypothetical protein
VATLLGAVGSAVFDFARRPIRVYGKHFDNIPLNSDIGYIRPLHMLAGHKSRLSADWDRTLEAAKERRKNRRQRAA